MFPNQRNFTSDVRFRDKPPTRHGGREAETNLDPTTYPNESTTGTAQVGTINYSPNKHNLL